mmetsp:Transcript_25102/g.73330  ORF Transcript_25102/g.73330 Transcript_25102/m.73330 type:complete len:208 (+) Transcript_25102:1257-1880(+)
MKKTRRQRRRTKGAWRLRLPSVAPRTSLYLERGPRPRRARQGPPKGPRLPSKKQSRAPVSLHPRSMRGANRPRSGSGTPVSPCGVPWRSGILPRPPWPTVGASKPSGECRKMTVARSPPMAATRTPQRVWPPTTKKTSSIPSRPPPAAMKKRRRGWTCTNSKMGPCPRRLLPLPLQQHEPPAPRPLTKPLGVMLRARIQRAAMALTQ